MAKKDQFCSVKNGNQTLMSEEKQFIFPEDTCYSFGLKLILFEKIDNVFTQSFPYRELIHHERNL